MWDGYKFAIDPDTNSLYAAQITSNNYLSGITSSDYFRVSQQVFLVSSLTDLSAVTTSGAGLYFDNNGQSQYFDGANWIDTSSEVVTELTSNANNDTIPTTKAVYDYVNQEILKIQTGNSDISQLLSGKADKFYVDEQDKDVLIAAKVYTNEQISGKADKYYVDEQDKGVLSAAKAYTNEQISGKADKSDLNGLASETYVLSSINTALTSSIKAIGTVATSADLPTTAAINDLYFVGPTNNKYTEFLKTVNGWEEFGTVNDIDLSNYATCSYVDEQVSGKIDKSIIDSQITDNSTDLTLPTSKAVYDFVKDNKEVFYIDTFDIYTEDKQPEISGFYIDKDSQLRFWSGTEWQYTSTEIVSEMFSNVNDNTVPTTKAVSDYMNANKEVFYIETFDIYTEENTPQVSGLYIDYTGQSKFWNGTDWQSTSTEISYDMLTNTDDNTVPTTKAVSDFVNANKEVFYIETFDIYTDYNKPAASGLYIDGEGQSKFWSGTEWQSTSTEISYDMLTNNDDNTVPTTKAVSTFVNAQISSAVNPITSAIITLQEDVEQLGLDVDYVTSEIPKLNDDISNINDKLENLGRPEVFYIETFDIYTKENTPTVSGLYIDYDGQSRFWTGSDWENTSHKIINVISGTTVSENQLPSVKAVYDFVNSKISGSVSEYTISELSGSVESLSADLDVAITNIDVINTQITNISGDIGDLKNNVSSGKEQVFYISSFDIYTPVNKPSVSGIYIDHDGQSRFWTGTDWQNTSHEIIKEITNSANDITVPTTKAVKTYVEDKIATIPAGSGSTEVFTIETFDNFPQNSASGIYVKPNGETALWTGVDLELTSFMMIDDIYLVDDTQATQYVPSVQAVKDYVQSNLVSGVPTISGSYRTRNILY